MAGMESMRTGYEDEIESVEKRIREAAYLENNLAKEADKEKLDRLNEYYDTLESHMKEYYNKQNQFEKLVEKEKAKLVLERVKKEEAEYKKLVKAKIKMGASETDLKAIKEAHNLKLKLIAKEEEKRTEEAVKRAKKIQRLEWIKNKEENAAMLRSTTFGKGQTVKQRWEGLKNSFKDKEGNFDLASGLSSLTTAIADMAKQLNSQINDIAGMRSAIDTRLQGWGGKTKSGSYWDRMSSDITGVAGISPLIKQENFVSNIKSMVGQGIAFNVEQRAFLATISDKIASTFNATDNTLLKLVRIQQADSTAARLGMESALTSFLNRMYETTEYMQGVASQIRSSLEEAESLMGAKSAAAFEFQVQKWIGSMYSVGSNNASSIASALGQLASGNVEGITNGGTGNLLVMAANAAGLSVGEILQKGITEGETNQLMKAMVMYLRGIYSETQDSLVVQQQYAKVFGLTASDLKAISNLSISDIAGISNTNLGYNGMISQLTNMSNSMYKRTSQAEMLTNLTGNMKYSMAAGIANNPVLYSLWTMSNMLEDLVGGIEFGLPLVLGSGTAQTFNIADMMKVGALSGSIISGISNMISAGGGGGISGAGMLKALGINNNLKTTTRGNAVGLGYSSISGASTSESTYITNSSSSDIQDKSFADAQSDTKRAQAKNDEEQIELKDVNAEIIKIFQLLQAVTDGSKSFTVQNLVGNGVNNIS